MTTLNHDNHETAERFVELKDGVAKRVDTLGALIQQHPLAALGIGLGIGYLLARLVHR
jgi:ElaB/YqjD/DUF883 family membrane-anchored ribosome-binding protein